MNKILLFPFLLLVLVMGCNKEDDSTASPLVKTVDIERVGYTVATCKVNYSTVPDSIVHAVGACWSTTGLPTIDGPHSEINTHYWQEPLSHVIMFDLEDNTAYSARAYISDKSGNIYYGDTMKFTTLEKKPVTIIFQHSYENYAWGADEFGYFIDSEGNIRGYKMLPAQWDPMIHATDEVFFPPDNNAYYSKTDLEFNYYLTDTLYGTVNLDTLNIMKNLIPGLISSAISFDGSGCVDYGTHSFYAYFLDTITNRYQRIVIETSGDLCCSNSNNDAQEIADWFFTVTQRVYKYYGGGSCTCGYH